MPFISLVALLAAAATAQTPGQPPRDALAGDPRLEVRVTLRDPSILLSRALGLFAATSDEARQAAAHVPHLPAAETLTGKLLVQSGEHLDDMHLALSAEKAPLADILRALPRQQPFLVWDRQGDRLVLRRRKDPNAQRSMLEAMAPRTDAQKELQAGGLELAAAMGRLPRGVRDALRTPGEQGGVPVASLPAAMRQTLARLFECSQRARQEKLAAIPGFQPPPGSEPTALKPEAVVGLTTGETNGVRVHSFSVRQPNCSDGFTVYEPPTGPPLPDEVTADPAVAAREESERRDLQAKDPRLDTPVTLKAQEALLADSLMELARQAGMPLVADPREVRQDPRTLSIDRQPAREALDALKALYGFEWSRSKEGVLVVMGSYKGRPENVAHGKALNGLAEAYAGLSSELLAGLATPEGVAFTALPAEMQQAVRAYAEQGVRRADPVDWQTARVHMLISDRNGRRMCDFGYEARTADGGTVKSSGSFGLPDR